MTIRSALVACCLLAGACGGTSSSDDGATGDPDESGRSGLAALGLTAEDGETGLDEAGDPVRGGSVRYGIEAETTGGWCLSEGQLAISGIQVVKSIYDTLTVPDENGEYVPYLAESVEPNDDFTQWTITIRDGVTFHDGSPLTAEVVKNNLDAYRGEYEGRSSLLFAFVLQTVTEVEAVDERTVVVDLAEPWVPFPAYLHASGRMGIMAQSQLDDAENCGDQPVGTGPFSFVQWDRNQRLVVERNPDYWQTAPDGEPYPYLDGIEFVPIPDGQVRNQAIEAGDVDLIHTSNSAELGGKYHDLLEQDQVNLFVSDALAEVAFLQLNHTAPPFDDVRMRRALAMAIDRETLNQTIGDGFPTLADGPYAPDSPGYVEDTDFPDYDPEAATALVEEYVADGGDATFTLTSTTDPTVRRSVEILQQQLQTIGLQMDIAELDQAALINAAIGKSYQAMTFRNYPGGDPDGLYVWFYSTSGEDGGPNQVNFAGVDDPEIDRLLDAGRAEADPEARAEIYQDLHRHMAEQVNAVWLTYTAWGIVMVPGVHGVVGPALPGPEGSEDGPDPSRGLATGHSLLGLWTEG
jgi:peptide/nickel transport system substrate-binding protein